MSKKRKSSDNTDHQAKKGFWALGLLKTMKDPKFILKSDDKITIIKDMYPKAQHHFLVLPNEDISSLKALNKHHLPLLKHMDKSAKEYVKENHPEHEFKFGYHAEASMHRLHLHAISDDMNSPALKTKKHWNTFTTSFFLDSLDVIRGLEESGKVQLLSSEKCKEYLNTPLQCHKCSVRPKNIPELKRHIITHI